MHLDIRQEMQVKFLSELRKRKETDVVIMSNKSFFSLSSYDIKLMYRPTWALHFTIKHTLT